MEFHRQQVPFLKSRKKFFV